MTVKIKYHYGREVGRDWNTKEATLQLVDWDFDLLKAMFDNLDDAGYTVISILIVNDSEAAKMGGVE